MKRTVAASASCLLLAACSTSVVAAKPQTLQDKVAVVFTQDTGAPPADSAGGPAAWLALVQKTCALSDLQLAIAGPPMYSQSQIGFRTMKDSMVVVCPAQAPKLAQQ